MTLSKHHDTLHMVSYSVLKNKTNISLKTITSNKSPYEGCGSGAIMTLQYPFKLLMDIPVSLLNALPFCFSVHQAVCRHKYPDPKNKKVKLNGKCLDSPKTSTSDLTQTGSQCSSKRVMLQDHGEEIHVSRKKPLARQTSLHSPVKVLDRWV